MLHDTLGLYARLFCYSVCFLFCVAASGCISTAIDRSASKYRNMFVRESARDTFRSKLGVPKESWELGATNQSHYAMGDAFAYDVFPVRGKIAKPGDGAAQATVNAISLGTAEAISIPLTVFSVVGQSTQRHTLVVYYDSTLHYKGHELYDAKGRKEDTSGY